MRMRLSIASIIGNESLHIERFIRSFAPIADEFCIAYAVGCAERDDTREIVRKVTSLLGVPLRECNYSNHSDIRGSWPHVDDFGKARQASFNLASGDWLMWADADDEWPETEENAELIARIKAGKLDEMGFSITQIDYRIPDSNRVVARERFLSKKGKPTWHNPIHEDCRADGKRVYVNNSHILHNPLAAKKSSVERNLRILDFATNHPELYEDQATLWFYKHRELMFAGKPQDALVAADKALALFRTNPESDEVDPQTILCYEILMLTAGIALDNKNASEARARAHGAMTVMPGRREAFGLLARIEFQEGNYRKMLAYTSAMRGIPEPKGLQRPWTQIDSLYSWHGAFLHHQALRLCGKAKEAEAEEENVFQLEGATISMIHPTMCRPELALETYNKFMGMAHNPGSVQYIFAVDKDDKHTINHLKPYRTVLCERGSRKAVEYARKFTTGKTVIVVEDYSEPVPKWDLNPEKIEHRSVEWKLDAPYEGYPNIISDKGIRYVICGKWGKSTNPDYEPQHCNFELGWEVNTAHVYAKTLLGNGKLRKDDVIVTLPGRKFFYENCFETALTFEEYCAETKKEYGIPYPDISGPKTLDLVRYFERNWHRYDNVFFNGPGYTWNGGHWDLIQSFKRCDVSDKAKERFLLMSLRKRPHESRRNTPDDFSQDVLQAVHDAVGIPIYLVGLNLPDFGVPEVRPCTLQEFASLMQEPNCAGILGPHSGPNGLAGLWAPRGRNILLFPMEWCPSIDNNYPSGMGKCLNLNGNIRHWMPVLSKPADIAAKAKEIFL